MARDLERKLPAAGGAGSGGGGSAAGGGRDIGLELSERIGASSSPSSKSPYSPGSIEYGATSAAEVAGRIALESARTHEGYRVVAAAGGGGIVSTSDAGIQELSIEAKMLKVALIRKDVEAEYEAILALAAKKEREGIFYEASGLMNYALNLCRASELSEDRRKDELIPDTKCAIRDVDTKRRDIVGKIAALENALHVSLGIGEISEEHKYDTSTRRYKLQLNKIREWTVQQLNRINENFVVTYADTGELLDEVKELEFLKAKELEDLFKEISKRMRELTRQMLQDCMELLGDPPCGDPPCEYAIICFGSMARDEMTPYSDFEWGILVNREDDKVKDYFTRLARLMQFRMINLGETILPSLNITEIDAIQFFDEITPRGFSMDGLMDHACKWPLGNEHIWQDDSPKKFKLLGQVESFVNLISTGDEKMHFDSVLKSAYLLLSNSEGEELYEQYRDRIAKVCKGKHDSESKELLKDLKSKYNPENICSSFREGQLIDVKQGLYRFPSLLIEYLSSKLGIEPFGNNFKKLKLAEECLIKIVEEVKIDITNAIPVASAEEVEGAEKWYLKNIFRMLFHNLRYVLTTSMEFRLRAYANKNEQNDKTNVMDPFDNPDQNISRRLKDLIKINDEESDERLDVMIMEYFRRVIPIFQIVLAMTNEKELKLNMTLKSRDPELDGFIYYRLAELDKASLEFEKDFSSEDKLINLASVQSRLGRYEELNELLSSMDNKAVTSKFRYSRAVLLMDINPEAVSEDDFKKYSEENELDSNEKARLMLNWGIWLNRRNKFDDAIIKFEEAEELVEVDIALVCSIKTSLANAKDSKGDTVGALKIREKLLADQRKLYGYQPSFRIAISYSNIGISYCDLKRIEDAVNMFEIAKQCMDRYFKVEDFTKITWLSRQYIQLLNNYGAGLMHSGKYLRDVTKLTEAVIFLEILLDKARSKLGINDPNTLEIMHNLAESLASRGNLTKDTTISECLDFKRAEELHKYCLNTRRSSYCHPPLLASSYKGLGSVLYSLGNHSIAIENQRMAFYILAHYYSTTPSHHEILSCSGNVVICSNKIVRNFAENLGTTVPQSIQNYQCWLTIESLLHLKFLVNNHFEIDRQKDNLWCIFYSQEKFARQTQNKFCFYASQIAIKFLEEIEQDGKSEELARAYATTACIARYVGITEEVVKYFQKALPTSALFKG